jgi:KipI family sensor histidine kinase inhibitor
VSGFRIVEAGDAAVMVEFEDRIDPAINRQAIDLACAVRKAAIFGVRDVAQTYRSVAVHFDPIRTDYNALTTLLRAEASAIKPVDAGPVEDPIRVPVCYGGRFGPDLSMVAAFAGATETDVVRIHTERTYRVFMLGFVPGFAYMASVDERIAAPRLSTPRAETPLGSVGIAGLQTGVYPASTPGGWRIVGRTPLRPFDLDRREPFLFKAGDAVRFYAIDPADYAVLEAES